MRKYLQGGSVAYMILLVALLSFGIFETFPILTFFYVLWALVYSYEMVKGGMALFFCSIIIGLFWISQTTNLFGLVDVAYAGLVLVTTYNLEK